jgi:hypothetical protein
MITVCSPMPPRTRRNRLTRGRASEIGVAAAVI